MRECVMISKSDTLACARAFNEYISFVVHSMFLRFFTGCMNIGGNVNSEDSAPFSPPMNRSAGNDK